MSSALVNFEHTVKFSQRYGTDFVLIAKGHAMTGNCATFDSGRSEKNT